jgi:hypothetical protein
MNRGTKSKFPITDKLIVFFLLYSILPASTNIAYLVIVLIIDVFSVLGIVSVRKYGREFFPSLILMGIGLLILITEIMNLVELIPIDIGLFLLAHYLILTGFVFLVNRWERDRA